MGENVKKVNLVLIVFILVLVIGICISAGILIFKNNEKKDNSKEVEENKTSQSVQVTVEEKYKSYSNNFLNQYKEISKDTTGSKITLNINGKNLKNAKVSEARIENNGDLNIIKNGKILKVKSDVMNCYELSAGNGEYTYIYIINFDGTVCFVDSETLINKNTIEVKNVENTKNIISLFNGKNGNEISIYGIDIEGKIQTI